VPGRWPSSTAPGRRHLRGRPDEPRARSILSGLLLVAVRDPVPAGRVMNVAAMAVIACLSSPKSPQERLIGTAAAGVLIAYGARHCRANATYHDVAPVPTGMPKRESRGSSGREGGELPRHYLVIGSGFQMCQPPDSFAEGDDYSFASANRGSPGKTEPPRNCRWPSRRDMSLSVAKVVANLTLVVDIAREVRVVLKFLP
jgi:hypothetical protein